MNAPKIYFLPKRCVFYEWFDDFVSTEDNLHTVKLHAAIPLLGDYLIKKDYSLKKSSQTLLLECT